MAKKLPISEPLAAPSAQSPDDGGLTFPTLTDERAKEIAQGLASLSDYDAEVFSLAIELALGLAPARPDDVSDNLSRFDVAYAFSAELFRLTPGFDSCARAYMHEVFESVKGDTAR